MKIKIDLNNLQTRKRWSDYLGGLRIKIATKDGIIVMDEHLKGKWLKFKAIENRVRAKFKLILALEKLRDSNENNRKI